MSAAKDQPGGDPSVAPPAKSSPVSTQDLLVNFVTTPGEQTSEGVNLAKLNFWSTIKLYAGAVLITAGPVYDWLSANYAHSDNKTIQVMLMIVGTVVAMAGAIQRATAAASFSAARSATKVAVAQTLSLPTLTSVTRTVPPKEGA